MHWITASLLSALLLGVHELTRKHAVRDNAVLPVIFLGTLLSVAVWLALFLVQFTAPGMLPGALEVPPMSALQHAELLLKSAIVTASWICTYAALKHLPVSIAAPIAATGPIWTVLAALVLFAERPTPVQWLGIGTTLLAFLDLSFAGRREGIHFHRDKWVWFMAAGTLLASISMLYDKFLLGRAGFTAATVQAWFSIYLAVLFLPLALGWKWRFWPRGEFRWRWSIPLIGVTLLAADYLYFDLLRNPAALISLVASLRRASVLVAFSGGILFFGETYTPRKLRAVFGVLTGIVLSVIG